MMRFVLSIGILVTCLACNSEDAFDCVKTTGEIIEYTIDLPAFSRIDVHNNIEVLIEQGIEQKVMMTTGTNLRPKITLEVLDGLLTIEDNNTCNWAREYGNTKIHIITNQLSQIRASGGSEFRSVGTLTFPELELTSSLYSADFHLDIAVETLTIINNDISNFYITGQCNKATIGFFAGDGRFEGQGLEADHVSIYHEGTNDIVVNPIHSLQGQLRDTGRLFYCGSPEIMNIEILDDRSELIQKCF